MSTLTLKKKSPTNKPETTKKVRSGARARTVAMRTVKDKKPVYKPSKPLTPTPQGTQEWTFFATCPQGIESILTQEMTGLGFKDVHQGRGGCQFKGGLETMMKANLYSRLATRILMQLAHAPVYDENDIYELAYQVPWEQWFGAQQTLRVDTSAMKSPRKSLQFCNLKVKDAICDRLRHLEGQRPNIDTVRPDARVQLFLDQKHATVYLDTSGESLFKRGWRLDKGEAPLRENLAAALLMLSGWDKQSPLFDPFCGSGTILIEAAYMAQNVPPGLLRPFGFERWRDPASKLWFTIQEEASMAILPSLQTPLFGSDLSTSVILAAQENQQRARLSTSAITYNIQNVLHTHAPTTEPGWIITNPPYGERLGGYEEDFWRQWSSVLKNEFAGWQVYAISNDLKFNQQLHLHAKQRTPLYNGSLECRFFGFDMVRGKHE